MAYAEWFVTTACATTSVTMFGTLGPWIELPDAFPPILWLNTSSTTTRDLNVGLWIMACTTVAADQDVLPYVRITQCLVLNFEPGTRWFMLDNAGVGDLGYRTAGSATSSAIGRGLPITSAGVLSPRLWKLYYRAVGEGPDPARMI